MAKYLDHGHVFCWCDAVTVWTCPDITVTVMVMNIVPMLLPPPLIASPDPASCCWPLNATYTILTRYLLCFANMTHSDTAEIEHSYRSQHETVLETRDFTIMEKAPTITFASASQFHVYLLWPWVNACLA